MASVSDILRCLRCNLLPEATYVVFRVFILTSFRLYNHRSFSVAPPKHRDLVTSITLSRLFPTLLTALLLAQVLWTLVHGPTSEHGLWVSNGLFTAVELAALALLGILWYTQRRLIYLLFTLAFLCQLGADSYYIALELYGLDYPEFSIADPLYLGFYVFAAMGLLQVLHNQLEPGKWLGRLLDSLIIASTAGTVLWQAFLYRGLSDSVSVGDVFDLAYVLLDLLILSLSLLLLQNRSERRGEWLLSAGLICFTSADIIYLEQGESYQSGLWLDVMWTLSLTLQATALWRMSQVSYLPRTSPNHKGHHQHWLWPSKTELFLQPLPYAAVLVACIALTRMPLEYSLRSFGVVWGTVTVMVLSTLRQWVTARDNNTMTRELTHQRTQLERLAYHDNLTGLKNRAAFTWLFQHHLSDRQPYAIFSLDLNGFKYINDTHGHAAGDAMLQHVARQLGQLNHRPLHIFRWGGDEFVLVALGIVTPLQAEQMMNEVSEVVQTPLMWNNQIDLTVGTSVGYALGRGTSNAEMLLSLADSGMYRAKQRRDSGRAERFERANTEQPATSLLSVN